MCEKRKIEWYKSQYPQGTRLQLVDMEDPYSPVPPGMRGTVQFVDDAGQIHMIWDNGRTLAIVPEVDHFRKLTDMEREAEECTSQITRQLLERRGQDKSANQKYPLLTGLSKKEDVKLHNIHEVACFICHYGLEEDLIILKEDGTLFLSTFGIYIDQICDMDYRDELLQVLIPMQRKLDGTGFDEEEDETSSIFMEFFK